MARTALLTLFLLFLLSSSGDADTLDSLQELFPRLEASEAEAALFDLVEKRLTELQIPYRSFDFEDSEVGHSFSRCLEANLVGERVDTLILCVPLNHPRGVGPQGSGSINIEMALRILDHTRSRRRPIGLKVLFLSAEFGDDPSYPMGSRLFLEEFYPEDPVIVLYLNLRSVPLRLLIRCGTNLTVSPNWLLDNCSANLKAAQIPFLILGNEIQFLRTGLDREQPITDPYLQAGYPAVAFEGRYGEVSQEYEQRWKESFLRFFDDLLDGYEEGIPRVWDRHYLFFQTLNLYLIVPETLYLIILVAILGLTTLYIQLFSERFFGNLTTVLINLWFPVLLLLLFMFFLSLSTFALRAILLIRNSPELWKHDPLLFLLLKALLTVSLFVLVRPVLNRLPYPRSSQYFSSAALFILLLNIAILAFIDISFTYYFLWAYLFIFLFAVFKMRLAKLLLLLISPFWLIKGTADLFSFPKYEFCQEVLTSALWGNLLIAIICLPYLLLILSFRFIFPEPAWRNRFSRRFGLYLYGLVCLSLTLFLLLYSPFDEANPQEIRITNTIVPDEGVNRTEFTSTSPLGTFSYDREGKPIQIKTFSRRYTLSGEDTPELLSVESSSTRILDRKNVKLVFHPQGNPYKLELSLTATTPFILLDSNFPFVREIDEESEEVTYRILIGKNPPFPLPLLLTLPEDRAFSLRINLEYLDPPFPLEVRGQNTETKVVVRLKQLIEVRT